MKQYFTGFFTGVCLVVSSVMFMGAGQSNSKVGKYAVYVSFGVEYLIDTETGQTWHLLKKGWKPRESTFLEE